MHLTYVHQQFLTNTLSYNCLVNNISMLLSISGGQDSVVLLKLILDIYTNHSSKIGLVYFDHKIRTDSGVNLQQILNICKVTRIRSYIYENMSTVYQEFESRQWRYNILLCLAQANHYSVLLTAHTSTDVCETFLQYIFRGSTIDSIGNIGLTTKYSRTLSIIKPLLQIKRVDTNWLSKKFCLPIWSDYTNYECINTRNRLRAELIPYLQQHFQSKLYYKVNSFLQSTKLDIEYLQKVTIQLYNLVKHPYFLAIGYDVLSKQPRNIQGRVLKLFFKHNFNMTISYATVNVILNNLISTQNKLNLMPSSKFKLLLTNSWIYVLFSQ